MAEKSHASRLSAYKNAGPGTNELRRKRAELSVALRKQARDEQLLKRRALSPEADEIVPETHNLTPKEIVKGLKSGDLAVMTNSARAARRMLSREQNPPISVMMEAGVVKPLVAALDRDDCTDLQFEAAWALTNIASGTHEHTMAVVDGGAVPKLVHLLGGGGVVGEQAAWALGNIAGDGPGPRDRVLGAGALEALLPLLGAAPKPATQVRTAVWTFSNLCRNKNPLVNFDLVSPALPFISDLLEVDDQDVLADACWALSYLTDGTNDRIEGVQQTPKLVERLIALLKHKSPAVVTPALRALGNMLTGSDQQTEVCLSSGCLPPLCRLLRSDKASLLKESLWALSNILAGSPHQIHQALEAGVLTHVVHALEHGDPKSQKEAAWAITNLCLGGSPEQLDLLLSAGFLQPYCGLLDQPDHKTVSVVLDGLTHLLQAAEKFGQVEPLCLKLEEIGALDRIEALQQHQNEDVYKKTLHILDTYFAEQDDQNAQPEQKENEYTFGAAQPNANINF